MRSDGPAKAGTQSGRIKICIVLILSLLVIGQGCDSLYGWIVADTPFTDCKKVEVLTGWGSPPDKPIFKVFGKAQFGRGDYTDKQIPGFIVDKVIRLSDENHADETEIVWYLTTYNTRGVPRRLEVINYGINPAPDLFKEKIPAKPLEIGTLYRAGYGNYVYFKIIKNPKGELVTLQGKSPNNLREK